ncbi:MAG: cyclic nucleotide-binding domain-containing protein [Elusimicrobiota bacterium]
MDNVVDFLKKSGAFPGLKENDLILLASITNIENYEAGKLLFKENDPGDSMFIIAAGSIKIWKDMNPGRKTITSLSQNELLGELSMIDAEPRSATAEAVVATQVIKIMASDLNLLIDKTPVFGVHFLRMMTLSLSRRLRNTTQQLRKQVVFG